MSSTPVLIVGSMAFDDLELPTGSHQNVVGGSATYCAHAASLFGPVRVVAVIGDDFPDATLEDLRERGVDVGGIERAKGKTFRWAGRYSENLQSRTTLDTQLNVFADFRPKLPAAFKDSKFVLLGNIHPALQLEVLEQCNGPRLVAADTMNFWIEGERKTLDEVLKRVDTLAINDEEVRQLTGEHSIRRAASDVLKRGPKRLIVKRGEYGALLFDEHGTFFAPSYPLDDEVDPTGAGDTFAGTLLGYLAREGTVEGSSVRRALMAAATVASFCVEGVGTTVLQALEQERIAERLEAMHALITV